MGSQLVGFCQSVCIDNAQGHLKHGAFMTIFTRDRRQNNLTSKSLVKYNPNGSNLVDLSNLIKNRYGTISSMQDCYVKGEQFSPGQLKVKPVAHGKSVVISRPETISIYNSYNGVVKPTFVVDGHIMALSTMPDWDSNSALAGPGYPANASKLMWQSLGKVSKPDIDLGVNLSEIALTISMLVNPIKAAANFLKKFSTRPEKKPGAWSPKKVSKYLGSKWLEYRYGWTPLVGDINSAMKLVKVAYFPELSRTTMIDRSESSTPETFVGMNLLAPCYFTLRYATESTTVTTDRAACYFSIVNSKQFQAVRYGTSLTNLPALIWELVPYSFVLDWWLDLGTWIRACTPDSSVAVKGYCVSRKVDFRQNNVGISLAINSSSPLRSALSTCYSLHKTTYQRWFVAETPFVLPKLDMAFSSVKHAVDAVFLSHQQFKFKR